MEFSKYGTAVLLDKSPAFDRVWVDGLLFKINQTLPQPYFKFMNLTYVIVNSKLK